MLTIFALMIIVPASLFLGRKIMRIRNAGKDEDQQGHGSVIGIILIILAFIVAFEASNLNK